RRAGGMFDRLDLLDPLAGFQGFFGTRPGQTADTSTRLSKNVAPPPRSVRAVLVVVLQFTPSAVYRVHQIPSDTTTPGFTVSPTTAFARNRPRSLNTVTAWPSAIPRAAASDGCISTVTSPAACRSPPT